MGLLHLIKANLQIVSSIGVSAIIAGKLGCETLFLESYRRQLLQLYKDGVETPVDKRTKELTQELLDEFEFPPPIEADIKFFTCYSQNPIFKGCTHLKTGSIIGLPANFGFKSVEDIDKSKMQVGQKGIDWLSLEGEKFAESIVLSDDAKRFAIARQLYHIKSIKIYIDCGFVGFFSFLAYWAGHASNVLLRLKTRVPTGVRGIMYTAYVSIAGTLYLLAKDEYTSWQDRKCDRQAAEHGKAIIQGGVEFYTKELERNKALRVLLGDYGKKVYTPYGNCINTWRSPTQPLTSRKDQMLKYLAAKENEENEAKSKTEDTGS